MSGCILPGSVIMKLDYRFRPGGRVGASAGADVRVAERAGIFGGVL